MRIFEENEKDAEAGTESITGHRIPVSRDSLPPALRSGEDVPIDPGDAGADAGTQNLQEYCVR